MVVVCLNSKHLMNTRGVVTRPPAREDERVATVTIPGAGPALLAKVLRDHIEVLNQLLSEPRVAQGRQGRGRSARAGA